MIKKGITILVAILLAALTGCSGTMKGVVRRDAKRIPITYSDSRIGKGLLQTVLPDGEGFEGKLAEIASLNSVTASDSTRAADGSAIFEAVQSFEGNAEAALSGNRGNTMKCRFRLADTIIGLSSGGFGICQVSDGRVIDIFF